MSMALAPSWSNACWKAPTREIDAIEAANGKLDDLDKGPAPHGILQEIGSAHLNEIERGAAIEAAGEKLDETASATANSLILQKIGSSHLSEIGVGHSSSGS